MKSLLVVALVTACAVSTDPRVIVIPPATLGRTDCIAGAPMSGIRGGLLVADSIEVDAHEARHREQMRRDCRGFLRRYQSDVRFKVRVEMDAYCYGIRTRPKNQWPERHAALLTWYLNHSEGIPSKDVKALFTEACL